MHTAYSSYYSGVARNCTGGGGGGGVSDRVGAGVQSSYMPACH